MLRFVVAAALAAQSSALSDAELSLFGTSGCAVEGGACGGGSLEGRVSVTRGADGILIESNSVPDHATCDAAPTSMPTATPAAAATVEHSGFLVDLFCWNAPNSIGVDGSDLINDPMQHSTKCMTKVPSCRANGFGILAQNDDGTYRLEYTFDAAGDAAALAFMDATQLESNIVVTVKGSLSTTSGGAGATPVLASVTIEEKMSVMVEHSGYLIDLFCWERPNSIGIDGSDLINDPKSHTTHCMRDIQSCRDNGYAILAEKSDGTFGLEYVFDAAGNAAALAFLDATKLESNVLVTVKGSLSGSTIDETPVLADATIEEMMAVAVTAEHSGYLIDLFCWERPNSIGIDGSDLINDPKSHTTHCMRDIQSCRDNGYAILAEKSDGTFGLEYVFDAAGNAAALAFLDATKLESNVLVTVKGSLSGSTADETPVLANATIEEMTVAVEHSGFLVDLFCWNAPNSTGVDGSDLINNPEAHSTKCMTKVPSCRANGFGLLAQNDDGTYRLEYVFDAAGDAAALAFMDATQLERNILVTVMGTLSSAGAGNGTTPVLAGATIEGKMAVTVEHSGFLVDLFCWNAPNSIGVDGSDLINNPMQHSTKCMTKVPSCRANGFGLLAQNDDGTYRLEYVFDAAGDAAALAFMDATQLESNIVVTVKGSPSFNGGAAPMLTDAIIEGQMAVTVEHSGFLVDLKCWNAPGSIGVDGSDLINDPKSHSTMCMTKVPSCRANGFGILAQNDDGTYRLEYIFDEAGDATALAFLDATQLENNILVTVKGSLAFDGGAAPVLAGLTVRAASRSEAPGAACYGGAAIFESKVSVSVPASPSKASAVTWAGDNAIGYAVNGVAIYSPFSESCGDAVSDVGSFDDCGGGPVDGGVYHYRTAPKCLDGYAAALAAKEPFFIGVALDGFPIYSKFSANGVELTNADLDECHGYESPEGYRYVANDEFPYVTYCYVGTPLVEFDSHCDGVDHATHDHGRRRLHNGEAHAMDTCTSSSSTEPMCTRTADEPVTADSAAAPAPMLHRLAAAAACLALLRAV